MAMAKQVRFDVEYNMGGAEQPGAPDLQVEGTEKKLPEGEEEDPTVLIGRRRLAANGRRASPSPEPASEQHTAVQDYLSSQLANLSGDPEQAETFKASIMGVAVGPADGYTPSALSPPLERSRRRKRRAYPVGKGPVLYPEQTAAKAAREAAAALERSLDAALPKVEETVPSLERTPAASAAFPQHYERWPAHSSAQQAGALAALQGPSSPTGDALANPFSPPVVRGSPDGEGVDVVNESTKAAKLRAKSVSPLRSSLSAQLLRTVPRLLQDLEYHLLRELEDNDWPELDHPIRARIIGDCFDAYINQCSTYKPLLSKIKAEYEERNALLSKQLEEVKPKLNKLATMERMVDMQKAADMKAHWKETEGLRRQNEAMKKEKWALEKTIREQQEKLEENRKRIFKFEEVKTTKTMT